MKKAEYLKMLEDYKKHLAMQDAKGSTGSTGKLYEEIVRRKLHPKHENADLKVGARSNEYVDATVQGIHYEIKTGSGAVRYAVDMYGAAFTAEDCTAENVLPGADMVAWAPFPKFMNEQNYAEMFWMFTREQFIACLESIGKKGLKSSLKLSKGGYQINIQTITPRMEDRLWDVLENIPTLEEYCK